MSNNLRREEIRGLFVLGLLAVVASIRIQQNEMNVTIGQNSVNVIFFLDITLVSWSLYAFFMVVGFSEDIFGKTLSSASRDVAKMFLELNFVVLAIFSVIIAWYGYGVRLFWASLILFVFASAAIIRRLHRKHGKIRKPPNADLMALLKATINAVLLTTISLCVLTALQNKDEVWVIPSAIVGSVTGVFYIIVRSKWSGKQWTERKGDEP